MLHQANSLTPPQIQFAIGNNGDPNKDNIKFSKY